MKRIYIMRHGKAVWNAGDMEDFDRPLKDRGHKAAQFMGSLLAVHQEIPDVLLVSTAVRARETAEDFLKALGHKVEIEYEDTLYMTTVEHSINLLRNQDDSRESAMIIGHNPTLEGVIEYLTADSNFQIYLPTCGVVCLDADIESWGDIEGQSASLKWFLVPKLFMKKHI